MCPQCLCECLSWHTHALLSQMLLTETVLAKWGVPAVQNLSSCSRIKRPSSKSTLKRFLYFYYKSWASSSLSAAFRPHFYPSSCPPPSSLPHPLTLPLPVSLQGFFVFVKTLAGLSSCLASFALHIINSLTPAFRFSAKPNQDTPLSPCLMV